MGMETTLRWTSADLEVLPDDGKRYEVIDGELYVSRQPSWHHQHACLKLLSALDVLEYSEQCRGRQHGAWGDLCR